jgi:hypothetical protein
VNQKRLERALVFFGVVLALVLVGIEWTRVAGEPLSPDAWNFRDLTSRDLRHPYDTGYREPFHCWLLWLLLKAGLASDTGVRALSVVLYFGALGIYYATTRKLFGPGLAAVCFFLFALSRKNAALAVEGLRNFEVAAALMLVALAGRRAVEHAGEPRRHALLGLASGLASLVYLSLLPVTQLWLWANYALERVKVRASVLALAIPVALVIPHLVDNKIANGDFLDTLDRHARFYRNIEYAGRPGMPTVAEVASDAYCGPPTTGVRYIVEGRSAGELARIFGKGFFRWATYRSPAYEAYRMCWFDHGGIPIWAACVLGGLLICARNRRFLWVPGLVLACGVPFVPLLGIHDLDGRLLNDYLFAWLWLLAGFTSTKSNESLAARPGDAKLGARDNGEAHAEDGRAHAA